MDYQLGGNLIYHKRIDPSEDNLDTKPKDTIIKKTLSNRKLVKYDKSKKEYYLILKIYKDGNYMEDLKIFNMDHIDEKHLVNTLNYINKNSHHYGYIYNLSLTWENAILETSSEKKFQIYYEDFLTMK